jgi:hypothetical protein
VVTASTDARTLRAIKEWQDAKRSLSNAVVRFNAAAEALDEERAKAHAAQQKLLELIEPMGLTVIGIHAVNSTTVGRIVVDGDDD